MTNQEAYQAAILALLAKTVATADPAAVRDLAEAVSMVQQAALLHASIDAPTVSEELGIDLVVGGLPN